MAEFRGMGREITKLVSLNVLHAVMICLEYTVAMLPAIPAIEIIFRNLNSFSLICQPMFDMYGIRLKSKS